MSVSVLDGEVGVNQLGQEYEQKQIWFCNWRGFYGNVFNKEKSCDFVNS